MSAPQIIVDETTGVVTAIDSEGAIEGLVLVSAALIVEPDVRPYEVVQVATSSIPNPGDETDVRVAAMLAPGQARALAVALVAAADLLDAARDST